MDRLTYWCDNGHGGGKWFVAIDAEGREDYGPHVDRLAAYEETGLEPEDFKQTFSEDTILKLAGQALGREWDGGKTGGGPETTAHRAAG